MSLALWMHPANLADCARALGQRAVRAVHGPVLRGTDADAIIESGIDACWNGRSFTASPRWFHTFWTRDMCFSSAALVRLGGRHHLRLTASLDWALRAWERHHSHVTTTFHPGGHPADVYEYGVDSLPFLLAALAAANADDLVAQHRTWLAGEIEHFYALVVDPATGLQRADRKFSAHRDTVTNRSTAFGNTMVALLAKTIVAHPSWNLPNPFAAHFPDDDFAALLRRHFWMTDRQCYRDSLGRDEPTGEANIWPFWTGVVTSLETMALALETLDREGFCDPFPLRYTVKAEPKHEVWFIRHVMPDYQCSSVWTSLGAMYLQMLRLVDPARARRQIGRYQAWIEREGTYYEVLGATGRCWAGRANLMLGEESMLWGSIFLDLLRSPKALPATLA